MSEALTTTTETTGAILDAVLMQRIKAWYQNADALTVEDDDTANAAAQLIERGKFLLDDTEGAFKPTKRRIDAVKAAVLDRERALTTPIRTAYERLRKELGAFLDKQRKAEEQARKTTVVTPPPPSGTTTGLKPAPMPVTTPAPPPPAPMQTRTVWKWKVADATKLPPAFQIVTVTANADMIDAVVQKLHESHNIPGVEVYSETVVVAGKRRPA